MMNQVSELKKLGDLVKLDELIFYKKLGYGQFGSVYMVKHKSCDTFFALKCVSKQQVVEQSLEKHLQVINLCDTQSNAFFCSKKNLCLKSLTSHS